MCIDSYINQRNRERNLKEAEEAVVQEVAEMKSASADPFTRRRCRPTLVTKTTDEEVRQKMKDRVENIYKMELPKDASMHKVSESIIKNIMEDTKPMSLLFTWEYYQTRP